jgi:hypothetical protein
VIGYLVAENRLLRRQLRGQRLRLKRDYRAYASDIFIDYRLGRARSAGGSPRRMKIREESRSVPRADRHSKRSLGAVLFVRCSPAGRSDSGAIQLWDTTSLTWQESRSTERRSRPSRCDRQVTSSFARCTSRLRQLLKADEQERRAQRSVSLWQRTQVQEMPSV